MPQTALLVGSSYSAAPIFFALKRRGLHVAVCGNDKADPCHQYADTSYYFDYSDRQQLLELVQAKKFDFLVPSCNDYSYMSCAWVAERCGFPGYDGYKTSTILHNKIHFREFVADTAVPSPAAVRVSGAAPAAAAHLHFPLLVKPVDSFSGRGMSKVIDPDALAGALTDAVRASRTGEALVEEFVPGNLHSHSAFVQDGAIVLDFFVDEYCTVYPYQVDCSNHPSFLPNGIRQKVRAAMASLIKTLGLCNGLLHTQFIVDGERFWIIECMRRGPGDVYGSLITFSTGIDYMDFFTRGFLRESIPAGLGYENAAYFGRHTISRAEPQVNFAFSCAIPARKLSIVPLKGSGERLNSAPYDKLAILFVEYFTEQDAREYTPRMTSLVSIQTLGTV